MKVKCPFYPATRRCIEPCPIFVDGKCDMEIKVSTDDLLAELERRRPDCAKRLNDGYMGCALS